MNLFRRYSHNPQIVKFRYKRVKNNIYKNINKIIEDNPVTIKLKDIHYDLLSPEEIPTLLKNIETPFKYNEDINKTAYLNWRIDKHQNREEQFATLGASYLEFAYNNIQICLQDNYDKKADAWIFPILFCIMQGIELYLKAINSELRATLQKEGKISDGDHNLGLICNTSIALIKEAFEKASRQDKEVNDSIRIINNIVSNIEEKTKDMTFARYPSDKKDKEQFYIKNKQNEVVDLELLLKQVHTMYHLLDFIYTESKSTPQKTNKKI